jgi:hypothetical protein
MKFYCKTREQARKLASKTGKKVIDGGTGSRYGKRWQVTVK